MAKKHSEFGPISRKQRSSALPSAIAGILVWIFIAINGIGIWHQEKTDLVFLLGVGAIGTIFLIAFNFFIIPAFSFEPALGWIYAGVAGMGMGLLTCVLPEQSDIYLGILWITLAITCALISGRRTSYFLLFLTVLLTIIIRHDYSTNVSNSALHFSLAVIAAITVETILQLKKNIV